MQSTLTTISSHEVSGCGIVGVANQSMFVQKLSSLSLSDVEGVWQGVESKMELRLSMIEELNEVLNGTEEQRLKQVSSHPTLSTSHSLSLSLSLSLTWYPPGCRCVSVCQATPVCWWVWLTALRGKWPLYCRRRPTH